VSLHRHPTDPEVRRLVASARVLVHPARSEGFGYPALEAMAAGVPVVAAAAGALPEVVGDAGILVPPGDPAALAAAVARAAADGPERAALVERGRRRAHAFPPRDVASRLLAVLRAAAGGSS
jgi:glycosyltransferase involved in cell wall biosynthesis